MRDAEGVAAIGPGSRSAPGVSVVPASTDPGRGRRAPALRTSRVQWMVIRVPRNRWWRRADHRLIATNPPSSWAVPLMKQNRAASVSTMACFFESRPSPRPSPERERGIPLVPGTFSSIIVVLAPYAFKRLGIGEGITVGIGCHPERSEGSGLHAPRSFAAIRMTVIPSPILGCLRPAILSFAKPHPRAHPEWPRSTCVPSLQERNLDGDIRPFPRFAVDCRCASKQLESAGSSAGPKRPSTVLSGWKPTPQSRM